MLGRPAVLRCVSHNMILCQRWVRKLLTVSAPDAADTLNRRSCHLRYIQRQQRHPLENLRPWSLFQRWRFAWSSKPNTQPARENSTENETRSVTEIFWCASSVGKAKGRQRGGVREELQTQQARKHHGATRRVLFESPSAIADNTVHLSARRRGVCEQACVPWTPLPRHIKAPKQTQKTGLRRRRAGRASCVCSTSDWSRSSTAHRPVPHLLVKCGQRRSRAHGNIAMHWPDR